MSGLMQRILGRRDAPPAPPETPADATPGEPPLADGPTGAPTVEPATPPPGGAPVLDAPGLSHPLATATAAAAGDAAASGPRETDPTAAAAADPAVPGPGAAEAAPTASAEPPTAVAAVPDTPSAQPAGVDAGDGPAADDARGSFRERGRMRRRLRFLRRLRELGYRDLGGLVFEQHRFNRPDEQLVRAKVTALTTVDTELRTLEATLGERRAVTELREPGLTACSRCGAVIGSDARFCSACGAPVAGAHAVATVGGPAATAPGPAQQQPPGEVTERLAPTPTAPDQPTVVGRPGDAAP